MFDVRLFLSLALPAALLFWATLTAAASPSSISAGFDSANELYERGKFTEAASAYEKMIQSGAVSPALYFNLGNSFFKAGEIGRAIAAYRHAEAIAPRDPDLRANLQFVRNQVQGPTLMPNRWQRWLAKLTVNEWTGLASVGLWVWLLSLALAQFRPGLKPAFRGTTLFSGIASAVLCLCLGFAVLTNPPQTAIVIAHEALVHNGPLDESQAAFSVHDGAELTVLDRKDRWLQISVGDRRIGWLKREQVMLESPRT
jgi:tetratricopeptide (TPR) repeat protein